MQSENFRNLKVCQKAFALAMEIFEVSKTFPKEERYALTSQIRDASRSVCSSIGEAYRKRQYPAHFASKSSDGDSENTEQECGLTLLRLVSTSTEQSGMISTIRLAKWEGC